FDTIGSLTAMGTLGGFIKKGTLKRMDQALMADAMGTTVGAVLGTSTVTTYIESSTGVAEGGRTGLTAAVVGVLFLISLFFTPLVKMVPQAATAPALIVVGILMTSQAKDLPWKDMTEALPAFLTLFTMPLTYSIANGLAAGFVSYPLIKLLTGRWRDVHPLLWILGGLFILRLYI
ncbi:MAG TPA: NCS2 family permease, partial [Thermosulfidibacter takaii]|nr:NCS2 family permease [Thermosulfidibacter takaii]